MTQTAVGYARISKDDKREGRGVARQTQDIAKVCERNGWALRQVLTENDVSASRYSTKSRVKYRRLLEMIESGTIDRVVVYDGDRLLRQPRELEDLIDLVERQPQVEVHTINGVIDLLTGSGRFVARTLTAKAAMESDDISRRVRRALDQRADEGKTVGARAFGYACGRRHRPEDCDRPSCPTHGAEPCPEECITQPCRRHCFIEGCAHDGTSIVEAEAALLRAAAGDVLAGATLSGIARRWNDLGVVTSQKGRRWDGTIVKTVLTNRRQAGLRVHRGEVVGRGNWEPIIDTGTHERLRRLLLDPSRRRRVPGRRHAFTGVIRSAVTGLPLDRNVVRGQQVYRAINRPGREAGHVTISAKPTETRILEMLFADATSGRLAERIAARQVSAISDAARGAEEPAALRAELQALAADHGEGRIERSEWLAAREPLQRRLRLAEAALDAAEAHPAAEVLTAAAGDLAGYWAQLEAEGDIDRQRAVLGAVFERIEIAPATRLGCRFDTGRIRPVWRA